MDTQLAITAGSAVAVVDPLADLGAFLRLHTALVGGVFNRGVLLENSC